MSQINRPNNYVGDTDAKASEVNEDIDTIYSEFNGGVDENNLNLSRAELKAALGDIFYPVGSIYTNATDNTDPSTLLGFGIWERFGKGRVMVGQDSTDADFDVAEETGGAKTHQLTEAEMPSHNHTGSIGTKSLTGSISMAVVGFNGSSGVFSRSGSSLEGDHNYSTGVSTADLDVSHNHSLSIDNTGSDNAHNNLQPYITVYMWKRTA